MIGLPTSRTICLAACTLVALIVSAPLCGQVTVYPSVTEPAAWERFALRVVNQTDVPVTAVRLAVPDVLTVLGVDSPQGWTVQHVTATDSTPQSIAWSGAILSRGQFREFPFLARLPADARRKELVFPVQITKQDGSTVEWGPSGAGSAPRVTIRGTTAVSAWGAFSFAGAAMGVAVLALALTLLGRRSRA